MFNFKDLLKKIAPIIKTFIISKIKEAKPKLEELVLEKIKELLGKAKGFIKEEKYETIKMELINKAVDKIKLPLIARPFKGLIKKELSKTLDNKLNKLLEDFNKRLDK